MTNASTSRPAWAAKPFSALAISAEDAMEAWSRFNETLAGNEPHWKPLRAKWARKRMPRYLRKGGVRK